MEDLKYIMAWWFFSVSILSLIVLYLSEYEQSSIILNIFIAPFSIIIYFVFQIFKDMIKSKD